MKWRLTKVYGGWIIEYKKGVFGSWQQVNRSRKFDFEPTSTARFSTKKEASVEMAKLIEKYS